MNLDEPGSFAELDKDDMLRRIEELPRQCEEAWRIASDLDLPPSYAVARHVVILGMGGSATGGALLQGLASPACSVPITIAREYALPAFVCGPDYLVIGCSYSGNTEETVAALTEALDRRVQPLIIATGGRLADLARERGLPLARFAYLSQPRAALGYLFTILLGVFSQLQLLPDYSADLAEAIRVMDQWQTEIGPEVPASGNLAKALARRIAGRLPVLYGAGHLAPVAGRWKTQFNENAKSWSFSETLPELHHNSVVGYRYPMGIRERAIVLMLRSSLDHPRVQMRWEVTRELLEQEAVPVEELRARGETRLAQLLSLVHLGDFVSYYLAILSDVDPTPIEAIAFLKQRLAAAG